MEPRNILHAAAAVFPLFDKLAPVPLSDRQRRALGGRIYMEAPYLVGLLITALRRAPALFSHLPFAADELAAQQERARAWWRLAEALGFLAGVARDQYLHEQSAAIDKMNIAVQVIAAERQLPGGLPGGEEREFLLAPFWAAFQRRRERLRERALKSIRQAADVKA